MIDLIIKEVKEQQLEMQEGRLDDKLGVLLKLDAYDEDLEASDDDEEVYLQKNKTLNTNPKTAKNKPLQLL